MRLRELSIPGAREGAHRADAPFPAFAHRPTMLRLRIGRIYILISLVFIDCMGRHAILVPVVSRIASPGAAPA